MRASRLLAVLLAATWPLMAAQEAGAQPRIRFESEAVIAEGFAPGARVVGFSVAREIHRGRAHLVRRDLFAEDARGEGRVSFPLDGPVPVESVWVALDLAKGSFAAATPEGMERREIPLPDGALAGEAGGGPALADRREFLEALLVRPGIGGVGGAAWGATVGDGGASDAGGPADGSVLLPLSALRPVAGSSGLPSPAAFAPGDILVGVDARTLEFYAARLGAADLPSSER